MSSCKACACTRVGAPIVLMCMVVLLLSALPNVVATQAAHGYASGASTIGHDHGHGYGEIELAFDVIGEDGTR